MSKQISVSLERSGSEDSFAWCVKEMDENAKQSTLVSSHASYAEAVSAASCLAFEAALTNSVPHTVVLEDVATLETHTKPSKQRKQRSKERLEKAKSLGVKRYLNLTSNASGST